MTKEHLGLALALNVPVFVVVTKIDMCPANILQGESSSSLQACSLPLCVLLSSVWVEESLLEESCLVWV